MWWKFSSSFSSLLFAIAKDSCFYQIPSGVCMCVCVRWHVILSSLPGDIWTGCHSPAPDPHYSLSVTVSLGSPTVP